MPKGNWKELREKRRIKRQQIDEAYKQNVPPQIKHLRQLRWFANRNPKPQNITYEGPVFDCPNCDKRFVSAEYLRVHITRKHYPHEVHDEIRATP